jgi:hypothetical protein
MGVREGVMIMRCDSVCQNQEIFQLGMGIGGCRACTALRNNTPRIPSLGLNRYAVGGGAAVASA